MWTCDALAFPFSYNYRQNKYLGTILELVLFCPCDALLKFKVSPEENPKTNTASNPKNSACIFYHQLLQRYIYIRTHSDIKIKGTKFKILTHQSPFSIP